MSMLNRICHLSGSVVSLVHASLSVLRPEDYHDSWQLTAAIKALWNVIIGHCLSAGQNHDRPEKRYTARQQDRQQERQAHQQFVRPPCHAPLQSAQTTSCVSAISSQG